MSVLDEVLFHASSPERHFFDALDIELDKISRFYCGKSITFLIQKDSLNSSYFLEKEKEAKLKLEALTAQMQFIAEYGRHLLNIGVI